VLFIQSVAFNTQLDCHGIGDWNVATSLELCQSLEAPRATEAETRNKVVMAVERCGEIAYFVGHLSGQVGR